MMRTAITALCVAASAATAAPFAAPEVVDVAEVVDWTKPPPPTAEQGFVPPTAKRLELRNGMTVLVVENHRLPIVAMSILVPGAGTAADPTGKGGVAAFTADLLDEGAGGLSAMQVAERQDHLGAQIHIAAYPDAAQISVTTLAKTLTPTIDLLGNIVMTPAFDAKDFERVKGDRATALELLRDRPLEVAREVLLAALYDEKSPYGHPGAGTRETFAAIGLDDVRKFYRQHWNPAVVTVVVVGDVQLDAVRSALDRAFGAWRGTRIEVPKPAIDASPAAQRLRLVDRPRAAQSDIRIGTIGIDRRDPRFFAFEVLTTALGGSFSSRLTQRLREQLGITYTARAGQTYLRSRGPFEIATSIVTPATGRGIAETLRIVHGLTSNPIPLDELERVKQTLIRSLPASFDDNSATAHMFADLALFELPLDFYAHYAQGIRDVTAKDVLAVAQAILPAKTMVVSVVGDAAKIRPQLRKLRLGNPALHDAYGQSHPTTRRGERPRR